MEQSKKTILYLCKGNKPDYMNDMALHGFITAGHSVDMNTPMQYMFDDISPIQKNKLYGKGFTLYGRLSKSKNVSHLSYLSILKHIYNKKYDLIVFGSIWRSLLFYEIITKIYPSEQIVFIDGEDHQKIKTKLIGKGLYFKRELLKETKGVYPIAFGIPKEHIVSHVPPKEKLLASIIPGATATYIFKTEDAYYCDYGKSQFAITVQKAGWDCLRHYEILANGCIPYFPLLENCPEFTMYNFPKKLVMRGNEMFLNNKVNTIEANSLTSELLEYTRKFLSTDKIAEYIINIASNQSNGTN